MKLDTKKKELERAFDTQFRALAVDLPKPEKEYRFHPDRRWRFDRAWPNHKVAVEIEGGIYGRTIRCHNCGEIQRARKKDGNLGKPIRPSYGHASLANFKADLEKYNEAARIGWLVLRFVNEDIYSDPFSMVQLIRHTLETRRWRVSLIQGITKDERAVLRLIAAGFDTKEVAERLEKTYNSIRGTSRRLCEKLIAPNRCAAVAKCLAWGILDFDEIPFQDKYVKDISEAFDEDLYSE